jgi:hypothetical protein
LVLYMENYSYSQIHLVLQIVHILVEMLLIFVIHYIVMLLKEMLVDF